MIFEYVFDLKRIKVSDEVVKAVSEKNTLEIFANMFEGFLKNVYPTAQGSKLRCIMRILDKLDIATSDGKSSIELDNSEIDLLAGIFKNDEIELTQDMYRSYSVYQSIFEKAVGK